MKFIDVKFETEFNGILNTDETIKLIPSVYGVNDAKVEVKSSDTNVVEVTTEGLLKGKQAGQATITLAYDELKLEFNVEVYGKGMENKLMEALVAGNEMRVYNDNVCLLKPWNNPPYLKATYGSVNLFLFDDLNLDDKTYVIDPNELPNKTSGIKQSTEFIIVHDTANINGGLTPHGKWWKMDNHTTSIHYTVGDYGVIQDLPLENIGHHAGDGTAVTFNWDDTGVKYEGDDNPYIDIDKDGYYTFNNLKTKIVAPTNAEGEILDASYFTDLGPRWKVSEDGNYLLGTTWFCTSQVKRGVIGSKGGNNNSTGLEMCVNKDADIYDTWQRSAKLVAWLLKYHNLGIDRVVEHNTFTGKNCPQSLRTANYWDHFMQMVALEHLVITKYNDVKITMKSNNPEILDNKGRIINPPLQTTVVTYTITIEIEGQKYEKTLNSIIPGTLTWNMVNGYQE